MATRKRTRPPNLTLRAETTAQILPTITLDAEDDIMQLSPPSSSSSTCLALSPSNDFVLDTDSDELSKDMAVLARLRESVQKNLRLRPIRSFGVLPKSYSSSGHQGLPKWNEPPQRRSSSPSSTASSAYYTPDDDGPSDREPSKADSRRSPPPAVLAASAWDPGILYDRLTASKCPILIDTRPLAAYQGCHILDSINIAIPSLILKRCRKPGGGFQNIDTLRQFITSDQDKHQWDVQSSPQGYWDGDIVIVYGEETDESEKDNIQVAAWALLQVLSTLLGSGRVHYLRGGIAAAQQHPLLRKRAVYQVPKTADPVTAKKSAKGRGLFHLNTAAPTQSNFPEIEQPTLSPMQVSPSDLPRKDCEATGSPAPSHLTFRHPGPPRRPSAPNLRCNTTDTGEQYLTLPRLQIRTVRSATLPITPTFPSANPKSNPLYLSPQSPSHLNLLHSNHSPPASSPRWTASPTEFLQPPSPMVNRHTPPRTPNTPLPLSVPIPPSPRTVCPDGQEQTTLTEEELPTFTVSMILPNFLYLGPELTLPEHVEELKALGIKRILNIAAECDDDQGLRLREEFERYVKIPMRDTVEEDKITKGLKEACEVLDEASLYGASTYVHCKAGKSRSVTAVMAYLIHANHWTLSRAYSFVLERRKGISPNIGFVSELMTFEEQELGGKSVGVVPITPGHGDAGIGIGRDGGDIQANQAYASQSRRPGHARESLPPMFTVQDSDDGSPVMLKAGEVTMGQDMEVKDAEGRYRHVRRAPVDENTLQPMRRVSKAGLESAYS